MVVFMRIGGYRGAWRLFTPGSFLLTKEGTLDKRSAIND
jgi:hypothetical protein